MGTGTNSTRFVARRGIEAASSNYAGQLGLIDASTNGAFAVSRDILVSVWRHPPTVAEAERLCDVLEGVVGNAELSGFWVITAAPCEIPTVQVRRLIALKLRALSKLSVFAVSVEAVEAKGALMRAAIRSTAVAGGVRSAYVASDVSSVASELMRGFPALPPNWGERVARILAHACDEFARGEFTRMQSLGSSPAAARND